MTNAQRIPLFRTKALALVLSVVFSGVSNGMSVKVDERDHVQTPPVTQTQKQTAQTQWGIERAGDRQSGITESGINHRIISITEDDSSSFGSHYWEEQSAFGN